VTARSRRRGSEVHRLFAVAAFRSDRFSRMVKGGERTLIEDGQINWENMCKNHIGGNDLIGTLRANGRVTGMDEVRPTRFERKGDIIELA